METNCATTNTIMLSDIKGSTKEYKYHIKLKYGTDIFNKPSRTTVCFRNKHGDNVMYCEKCNQTHINNMDTKLELTPNKEALAIAVKCNVCETEYDINDIKTIERYSNDKHKGYLYENTRYVYKKIFDDGYNLKLAIKTCSIFVEDKFFFEDNSFKFVFNTDTGYTYLCNTTKNKVNRTKNLLDITLPIANITYMNLHLDKTLSKIKIDEETQEHLVDNLKEIHDIIHKKISEKASFKVPTLQEYAKQLDISNESEIYTLENLIKFNRFPGINPFYLKEMMGDSYNYSNYVYRNYVIPYKFNEINRFNNISNELCKVYNLNNKDILNDYFSNYHINDSLNIFQLLFYMKLFKEEKHVLNIIEKERNKEISLFDTEEHYIGCVEDFNRFLKRPNNRDSENAMLLNDIKANLGESKLYDIIISNTDYYGIKTLKYASKVYSRLKNLKTGYEFDLEKIYDILTYNHESLKDFANDKSFLKIHTESILNKELYKINDFIYEKHKKSYKFNINTLEEYFNMYGKIHKFNFDIKYYNELATKLYYYNPTENPYKLMDMHRLNSNNYDDNNENNNTFLKSINPKSTNVIGDLLNYYNIPNTKSIKKYLNEDSSNLPNLIYYSSLFKDINVLNNVIKSGEKIRISSIFNTLSTIELSNFKESVDEVESKLFKAKNDKIRDYYYLEDSIWTYKFLKEMINEKGEVISSKKVINAKDCEIRDILHDIGRMYKNYIKLYKGEKFNFNGNIVEIHDRLVRLTGSASNPFTKEDLRSFRYKKEDRKLIFEKDGYSFKLAKNGKELKEVGYKLKNCVGSYVDSVRRNQCIIVPVKYKDEYKICIELRKEGEVYKLYQAKLYANSRVSNDTEALNIVLEWMDKNNIINTLSSDVPKSNYCEEVAVTQDVLEANNDYDYEDIPF